MVIKELGNGEQKVVTGDREKGGEGE